MATKLEAGGEVVREIKTDLREDLYREGCTVKITPEGVFLKAPNKRWTNARFADWATVLRYADKVDTAATTEAPAAPAEAAAQG